MNSQKKKPIYIPKNKPIVKVIKNILQFYKKNSTNK